MAGTASAGRLRDAIRETLRTTAGGVHTRRRARSGGNGAPARYRVRFPAGFLRCPDTARSFTGAGRSLWCSQRSRGEPVSPLYKFPHGPGASACGAVPFGAVLACAHPLPNAMHTTPHRTPDTRVTQRLKASCRRRMRVAERGILARVAQGADPDALLWSVPRSVSDVWDHD